ncbi:MAG: prefoldin subunit beta [Candidatus Aenigmarchaeota archaeon]|nr:prefoldin subunit beta [Candidatus Aenigmarchaeota archaeon]
MVKLDSPNILEQFQLYQQQYQTILLQKEQIRFQQLEIEKALEELEASKSEKAYKITGPIMIKKDTEDLKKELQEKKEDMDLRLKTLTRAEERVAKKLQEMEDDLKKMIKK